MPRFLILARDRSESFADFSPADMQALIQRYVAWGERLAAGGHLEVSHKLKDGEGRVLGPGGTSTDGPFTEAKEVVGGFWLLTADDLDHAHRLVADCPHLDFGSLELRAIEDLDASGDD